MWSKSDSMRSLETRPRVPGRGAPLPVLALATVAALMAASARAEEPRGLRSQLVDIRPLPDSDTAAVMDAPPAGTATAAGPPRAAATAALSQRQTAAPAKGRGVRYRRTYVRGVGLHVIEADMRDPQVQVGAMLARGGVGRTESFTSMMGRSRPAAAITGTFFGLSNRQPTGDLVIDGSTTWRGFIGTALAITADNHVAFVPTEYKGRGVDWSSYQTVMRGGPTLLAGREFTVSPQTEGFFSLGEFSRRWRTAVGITRDNRLLLVAVRQSITFWELAKVLYSLGAYDAVALDGGTSTALYHRGKVVVRPGRALTNALLIYDSRTEYQARRPQFGGRRLATIGGGGAMTLPDTADGSGFEPAMPDPARPRGNAYQLDIRIAPVRVGR